MELGSCLHFGIMCLCFELGKEKIIVLSLKIKEYSHIKAVRCYLNPTGSRLLCARAVL